MAVTWSLRARADLSAIFQFIARDDPSAAERWIARLVARAESVADLPYAGRVVPEFRQKDIREVIERKHRIVYRVEQDAVAILTVFEGHRLLRAIELEEEDDAP